LSICALATLVISAGVGRASAEQPATRPVVAGIPLSVPPGQVVAECGRAARALPFAVFCPAWLPAHWSAFGGGCPKHGCPWFTMTGYFPGPTGYVGDRPRSGHLNVWELPRGDLALAGVGCPGVASAGRVTVDHHVAHWFPCPAASGLDGGHALLQWVVHGIAYGVSAHGWSARNRRLVLFVAAHLKAVH
jgi:hypothetical protein